MLSIPWIERSFKRQIVFTLFSLIFLTSILAFAKLYYTGKKELGHILESQAHQMLDRLAIAIESDVRYNNYFELSDTITNIYQNNNKLASTKGYLFKIIDISVLDLNNRVLAHSDPKNHPLLLLDKDAEEHERLYEQNSAIQVVWNQDHTELHVMSPIAFGLDTIGTVYMHVSATSLIKAEKALLQYLFTIVLILVCLLFIFVLLFGRWIEKPLHDVIEELDELGTGKVRLPSLSARKDEFSILASSLIKADIRIHSQKKELFDIQQDLHAKVKMEVDKNHEKEQHMLHQSRLAQMGELLSMIAHQWRQPLAGISAIVSTLKVKYELGLFDLEKQGGQEKMITFTTQQLDQIEKNVTNLSHIITDFKDFYKPSRVKELVHIEASAKKAFAMIKASLKKHKITYNEEFADTPKLSLYPNELTQVILNLFQNAIDEMLEKGTPQPTITVKTSSDSHSVFMEVYDNGNGIDEKIFDKIFDPYFSTKASKNGSGLGLYMSKVIIEDHHNGRFYLKKESEQTCFVIAFPVNN